MAGVLSLKTPSTGLVTLTPTDTATDKTITLPATTGTVVIQDGTSTATVVNLAYTGTLTGGTGVVNLGSGQVYKDASGNVGIGTSAPASKLEVTGDVQQTWAASMDRFVGSKFSTTYELGVHFLESSRETRLVSKAADSTGLISFYTGVTPTERMRIDSSGNVGIGTISPTYRISSKQSGNTGAASLGVVSINSANDTFIGIGYDSASDTNRVLASFTSTGAFKPISFWTSDSERMRIDSSGNLLVGKTALPSASVFGFAVNNSSNNFPYLMNSVNTTGTGTHFQFFNPNGNVGSITTSGSATSYVTSSDYRLKENVAPMQNALATIAALKPVTYTWKADGSDGQGFIAHELQAVVHDCVTGTKDAVDAEGKPQYQGVDTSFLVATLTAAIQEQQALIQNLTTRLNTLEGN